MDHNPTTNSANINYCNSKINHLRQSGRKWHQLQSASTVDQLKQISRNDPIIQIIFNQLKPNLINFKELGLQRVKFNQQGFCVDHRSDSVSKLMHTHMLLVDVGYLFITAITNDSQYRKCSFNRIQ